VLGSRPGWRAITIVAALAWRARSSNDAEEAALSTWTAAAVLQAAAEWVWVPPDAKQVVTGEYQLIAYPQYFQHPTQVAWSASERPTGDLIDEVAAHVRDWGRDSFYWWVRADTRPADTEAILRARGATLAETVHVLAYDLAVGLPDLGVPGGLTGPAFANLPLVARRGPAASPAALGGLAGVRAEVVTDERALLASDLVNAEVWDEHRDWSAADVAAELAEIRASLAAWSDFRVVVYADAEPAAAGGCGLVGDVARLWGAGVRARFRGRGIYRVLLAARLALAREHGATLALVKGRVETSGPILRRAGFTGYSEQRSYCLPV
jgi:GNAT superfamily N-acetyltransferase